LTWTPRALVPPAVSRRRQRVAQRLLTCVAALSLVSVTGVAAQPASGAAARVLTLSSQSPDHPDLSPWLDWLEESAPDGTPFVVTTEDEQRFRPAGAGACLGFRSTPLWFRLRVTNDARTPASTVFELGFTPSLAELYLQEGSSLVKLARSGTSLSFGERPVQTTRIAFRVTIAKQQTSTYFLRVQSNEAIWPRASLWSEPGFAHRTASRSLFQGIYYGLLWVMIIYNGFIYASTRERVYLLYVVFETATLLLQAALDKVAFQYLWPRAPGWAQDSEQVFGAVTIVAAIHFVVAFLEAERHAPRLARVLRVLGLVSALLGAVSLISAAAALQNVLGVVFLGCLFTIAAVGVVSAANGHPNARFFLLGWLPLLVGGVLAVLAGLGVYSNEFGLLAFKIGSAAEATILALALANRINLMRRERERADAELLTARTAQSLLLEERVTARTHELSEALDRLRHAQDKLMRQERVTALAGMVAGMAHEVGNPLNFAQGGSEVLRERIDGLAQTWRRIDRRASEECAADAEQMNQLLADTLGANRLVAGGLQRIGKIMANLRGYMQLRVLERRPTDLVAELESTLAMVEAVLDRHGVAVVKRLEPLPPFPCRPGELNQVFMNIVVNASAAMVGGGRLEITACVAADGGIEIQFADTGPGILPAHREAVFEPFFSERATGEPGTGLGLYLSREIVTRHGGELALLESERGACFRVRLPAAGQGEDAPIGPTRWAAAPGP
jgi:signal transduction histidine kinase